MAGAGTDGVSSGMHGRGIGDIVRRPVNSPIDEAIDESISVNWQILFRRGVGKETHGQRNGQSKPMDAVQELHELIIANGNYGCNAVFADLKKFDLVFPGR